MNENTVTGWSRTLDDYYRKRIDERDLKASLDLSNQALDALQKVASYYSCEESWTQVGLHDAILEARLHVRELMTLIERVRKDE